MTLNIRQFLTQKTQHQVEELDSKEFGDMPICDQVIFLKEILSPDLPSITTARALEKLKELNYPDRYYFRKFLYHIDRRVSEAAREAIRACNQLCKKPSGGIVDVLKEGQSTDRVMLADVFLEEKGKLNEQVLLSFLSVDDRKVRESIVKNLTADHEMDEAVLSESIARGSTWYMRAALVEILGNRRSRYLLDVMDVLMNDRNVEVKLKLVQALLKFEMETRKAYLQKLAADSLIWVRKEAQRALRTN